MLNRIKSMLRRPLLFLLACIGEAEAAQTTGSETTTLPSDPVNPTALPPGEDVSPEEAMEMWDSPPAVLATKRMIVNVQPDGSLPGALEQIHLSRAGKCLSRVDFAIADDFGVQGKADESPGQCQFCRRYAYHARPCALCGNSACQSCGGPALIDEQPVFLCSRCERKAEWQKDNWKQETSSPRE